MCGIYDMIIDEEKRMDFIELYEWKEERRKRKISNKKEKERERDIKQLNEWINKKTKIFNSIKKMQI